MGGIRGMIKVSAPGNPWTVPLGILDALAGVAPFLHSLTDALMGTRFDYAESEYYRELKQVTAYAAGGQALYADNLQLIYHGKMSEAYYTKEEQIMVKSNELPYREINFKSTIGPTDPDLPRPFLKALHNFNGPEDILNLIIALPQQWVNEILGIDTLMAYFDKRAYFLREYDDVPVEVSSFMFAPVTGLIWVSSMNMEAGAELATFDVVVKEIMNLVERTGRSVADAPIIEPGVTVVPQGFGGLNIPETLLPKI